MVKIAIIGGTGVYDPNMLENVRQDSIKTPYGEVPYRLGDYAGKTIAFIPRHGAHHSIPPHLINYRANIWAMKKLGVKIIIATTAVGSINRGMKPGDFVLVNQFIDFTKNRISSFFDGGNKPVVHVDVTVPYCPTLRGKLWDVGKELNIPIHKEGTYVCTEGPRFETPAEIQMFERLGGDVVGMTNVPEAPLAREAEICYATVSMVTNFAAGISKQPLTHAEVLEAMQANSENFRKLIMATVKELNIDQDCDCQHALAAFGGFKV